MTAATFQQFLYIFLYVYISSVQTLAKNKTGNYLQSHQEENINDQYPNLLYINAQGKKNKKELNNGFENNEDKKVDVSGRSLNLNLSNKLKNEFYLHPQLNSQQLHFPPNIVNRQVTNALYLLPLDVKSQSIEDNSNVIIKSIKKENPNRKSRQSLIENFSQFSIWAYVKNVLFGNFYDHVDDELEEKKVNKDFYGSRSAAKFEKKLKDYNNNDNKKIKVSSWSTSSWKTSPWTYKKVPQQPIKKNSFSSLSSVMNSVNVDSSKKDSENAGKYEESLSLTGRVFVQMFGYPSTCEYSGNSHTCTLSITCWMIGGVSKSGCGGNSWLVTCCIKRNAIKDTINNKKKQQNTKLKQTNIPESTIKLKQQQQQQRVKYKQIIEKQKQIELKEGGVLLQRRNDEVEECGLSSDRVLLKRIIGGTVAKFAQFPWQAHLKIAAYQCGGVLVTRRYVATAAHCIIRARLKDITVYLGELDTQDTGSVMEYAPAELHRVRKKIIHPKFQFRLTQPDRYDLALLEMVTDAGFSYHIIPICLPDVGINLKGRKGVVAGWGKIKPSAEPMGTNILRSANVPILGIEECMKWHKNKQITVELHEEMLCAGHEDGHQDACLGDSGGPLIVLDKGRWTLAGITSAGFGCGEPNQPGIYHSIPVTVDWIRTVVYNYN